VGRNPAPGFSEAKIAESGTRNGKFWLPAECDVSIRPGWFWHESENDKVKTPEQLRELYFKNVGRGASFLLNVPPDRRGQIHPNDEKSLLSFKKMLNEAFAKDLAKNASLSATNVRGGDPQYAASKLTDGDRHTYWSSDDNVKTPFVTLSFRNPIEFNLIRLREALALGQRIDSVAVDIWADSKWQEVATATSIGNCRLIQLEPVRTPRVRLRVTKASACPCLSEIGLFLDPNDPP
jgi:alpha-L-fucosidase